MFDIVTGEQPILVAECKLADRKNQTYTLKCRAVGKQLTYYLYDSDNLERSPSILQVGWRYPCKLPETFEQIENNNLFTHVKRCVDSGTFRVLANTFKIFKTSNHKVIKDEVSSLQQDHNDQPSTDHLAGR